MLDPVGQGNVAINAPPGSPAERLANLYLDYEPAPPRSLRAFTHHLVARIQSMRDENEAANESSRSARA